MTRTAQQIATFYGSEVNDTLNANRKFNRLGFADTFDMCEIMFWFAFANIAGTIVSTLVYNLLVNGRLF